MVTCEVTEVRVALTVVGFPEAVGFDCAALGLEQIADWSTYTVPRPSALRVVVDEQPE